MRPRVAATTTARDDAAAGAAAAAAARQPPRQPPKQPPKKQPSGGGLIDHLALDRAGGEPADEVALQHVERDHHRHARHDRAGGEQAVVGRVLRRRSDWISTGSV